MTIHKSKGLEFNVVIYPDAITNLSAKGANTPEEEWVSPTDLGFDPIPNLEKVLLSLKTDTPLMGPEANQLFEKEQDKVRLDNLNLLYVAFTRAKQRLYVIADNNDSYSKTERDPKVIKAKTNIIKRFLSNYEDHLVSGGEAETKVYCFGDPNSKPTSTVKVKTQNANVIESKTVDWMGKISVDDSPTMFWNTTADRFEPTEWGKLVHEILSKVMTVNDIDQALRPYRLDGTIDKEMEQSLKSRILQMAQHPVVGVAFGDDVKVKNECEILYQGTIIRPDRYAELSDVIYLLDYKTGRPSDEYPEQLRKYAKALREMVDKEIKAYLVYISDNEIDVSEVELNRR